MADNGTNSIMIIQPDRSWLRIDWYEIWAYRDLLFLLVRRDFVSRFKQTILGPAWFIIHPLVMTLVFSILFNKVAKLSTDELPPMLFYLSGLLAWNYCNQTFNAIAVVFHSNAHLFSKVYFPRLVVPLSQAFSGFISLALQLGLFFIIFLHYKYILGGESASFGLTFYFVMFPLVILIVSLLSIGVGLWMACMTAKYRDLTHSLPFLTQVWFYGTPIIFPISQIPDKWQWILYFNPMTAWVECIRFMLLGTGTVTFLMLLSSCLLSILIFISGILFFNRTQRTFVDTV